jgi:hypothetical protein
MRVASILLGVAVDEGSITTNLAKGLKLPGAEGRDQVWPDASSRSISRATARWRLPRAPNSTPGRRQKNAAEQA